MNIMMENTMFMNMTIVNIMNMNILCMNKIIEYITDMNSTTDDNEPDDWAHIIHEYLLNEQAYSEQVTSDHPCRSTEYEQRWMILIITETKETLIGI